MAAHPDQIFIDGAPVAQVATRAQVGPGKFYVDYATDELVLGSDPTGKQVRASDLGGAALTRHRRGHHRPRGSAWPGTRPRSPRRARC